jgi:hypothetical protein
MGNLKARFSSRKPERSTSANYANIEKDQIVRVHIIVQGSECPATSLSNNTINNSGLNGLSVCGEIYSCNSVANNDVRHVSTT